MKPIIFTLLLFLSFSFFSQNKFSIQGNITSKSKENIAVGDVLLYENNKIIAYTSLSEGQFSLTPVIANTYLLKIICVGYEDYEKEILLKENLKLEIILNEKAENLDGISIRATKKVLENKGGNIVANVEGTILAKEMSTIELLSKLPNLQISADGEQVSIIGKGSPLIYVDRQRISLEELQTLQVDDIKTIEIINNPSVKYEAEGRAVLLIIKRRNFKEGTQLKLTEKVSSKTFVNNYLGSNLSVKKNNLEWKLNAAYNQLKIWEKNKATYEVTNKNIFSDYEVEAITTRPQYIFGGGLYYSINDTDYISFNSIFRTQNEPFTIDTNTFLEDNGNQQNINTLSNNEGERIFSSSNINYFKAFNAKQNLFLGVQYTNYTRDVDNSIRNTFENATTSDLVTISQDFNVESFVLKGDYSISFEKGNLLEIGFNTARNVSKSLLQINQENSNYKYIEAINALYSQFSGGKEKYHYAFGFRLEDTNIEGGFRGNNTLLVDRNNIYIFPRANINFKFSDERSLNFSFTSSINRPNYSTAVTTTAFINPGLEFQGNINLKPTTINEISSSFQVKDKSISLEYFKSKNPVNYRFFFDETRDISIMSPTNFNEEIGVNLKVSYPFKYKFWTSTNTATFSYSLINDESILKKEASPYLYFYTNQQFKINNLSSFNLNGWLLSNRKDGIFNRQEVFTINAVFTTKLFSKLDVTVSANDIFNTMEFRENYVLQNLNVSSLFFTDVNEFAISLRYVFGDIKDSNYKNKSVDDELNRMN